MNPTIIICLIGIVAFYIFSKASDKASKETESELGCASRLAIVSFVILLIVSVILMYKGCGEPPIEGIEKYNRP